MLIFDGLFWAIAVGLISFGGECLSAIRNFSVLGDCVCWPVLLVYKVPVLFAIRWYVVSTRLCMMQN